MFVVLVVGVRVPVTVVVLVVVMFVLGVVRGVCGVRSIVVACCVRVLSVQSFPPSAYHVVSGLTTFLQKLCPIASGSGDAVGENPCCILAAFYYGRMCSTCVRDDLL